MPAHLHGELWLQSEEGHVKEPADNVLVNNGGLKDSFFPCIPWNDGPSLVCVYVLPSLVNGSPSSDILERTRYSRTL